jgi:hypothetical protein
LMGKTHENIKTIGPLKRWCNCWFCFRKMISLFIKNIPAQKECLLASGWWFVFLLELLKLKWEH